MTSRRAVMLAWLPALAYMAAIWAISSLSLGPLPLDRFPLRDKGIHFLEYGLLGFLVAHAAFRTWPRHARWRTAAVAIWITVLWGLLDEIHQAFVPGRESELLDVVADGAGALAGTVLRRLLSRVRRALRPRRAEGAA